MLIVSLGYGSFEWPTHCHTSLGAAAAIDWLRDIARESEEEEGGRERRESHTESKPIKRRYKAHG